MGWEAVRQLDPGLLIGDENMGLWFCNRWIIQRRRRKPGVRAPVLSVDFALGCIGQGGAAVSAKAAADPRRFLYQPDRAFGHSEVFCRDLGPCSKSRTKGHLA